MPSGSCSVPAAAAAAATTTLYNAGGGAAPTTYQPATYQPATAPTPLPRSGSPGPAFFASSRTAITLQECLSLNTMTVIVFGILDLVVLL